MPMPRTQPVMKSCIVCGKEFPVCPPGRSSKYLPPNSQQMCSNECQQAGRYRRGAPCNPLSPTDAAYIAGFLDGEGSIILYKRKPTDTRVALRVSFANCDWTVLEWIRTTCGVGNITHKNGTSEHREGYLLLLNSDPACGLLEQVRPYLKIKGEQADIAIDFQQNVRIPARKADHAWQLEARDRMMFLNKRGNSNFSFQRAVTSHT